MVPGDNWSPVCHPVNFDIKDLSITVLSTCPPCYNINIACS